MWLYFVIGSLFISLGLAVHVFKMYFLISGYNTMREEKKANVDTEKLGRLMGVYCYANGGVLILTGMFNALGIEFGLSPSLIFLAVSTVYLLIKAQKYDHNIYDENGKLKKGAWKQLALPLGATAAILIFVATLMLFLSKETKVILLDGGFEIQGIYGDIYSWDSIEEVKLIEELPNIEMRTNGSAVGARLKGHFRTTEFGQVKLFVDAKKEPFICIKTSREIIIFNTDDSERTESLFKEIMAKVN